MSKVDRGDEDVEIDGVTSASTSSGISAGIIDQQSQISALERKRERYILLCWLGLVLFIAGFLFTKGQANAWGLGLFLFLILSIMSLKRANQAWKEQLKIVSQIDSATMVKGSTELERTDAI